MVVLIFLLRCSPWEAIVSESTDVTDHDGAERGRRGDTAVELDAVLDALSELSGECAKAWESDPTG